MRAIRPLSEREVPPALRHLPRFIVTSRYAATREEAQRTDIAFGIRTVRDLLDEADRRFGPSDRRRG